VYALGLLSELTSRIIEHPLEDLNRPVVRVGARWNYCDARKASAELGYALRPFEETVKDTLRDLAARGLAPAATPALQALAASAGSEARAACAPAPALAGAPA
jgi:hypothetical protein